MKLRTKIQISFSITMAILLIIIGMVTQKLNTATVNTLTDNSIATSATLASNHIEGIRVEASSSDMIPEESDLIVCQKEFRHMLPESLKETKVFTLESLVKTEEYGCLVEWIRKRNG